MHVHLLATFHFIIQHELIRELYKCGRQKPLGTHFGTPSLLFHLVKGMECSADSTGVNFRAYLLRFNPGTKIS